MTLTDTAIRALKPQDKPVTVFDGNGLFLMVTPKGGKWWRLQYRFGGKRKLISLGVYPDISLKDARIRCEEARKLIIQGIDPSKNRKARKKAGEGKSPKAFEIIAREWLEKQRVRWVDSNTVKVIGRLEKDVFPWLGARPIDEILAPDLLEVLERIENRGAVESAHRVLQSCSQIFRFAIASGRARYNPCGDLRGALKPVKKGHLAAITDPDKVGGLMRAIHGYEGDAITRAALRLAPLVFVRPGELRHAQWNEINFEKGEWNIPAERMKLKNQGDHLVPLSTQAISILKDIKPLTGRGKYVFPGVRGDDRPISDNTVNGALRRLGFSTEEMTGHGFRAMARTILDEVLHIRPDYIEHQLAHAVRDPNGRAYNRTSHLPERKKMMQDWSDYLDKLAANAATDDSSKAT